MRTAIVTFPDKKENLLTNYFKKHRLQMRILEPDEDEDLIAKWIDEGVHSEDIPLEKLYELFRKNGVKC